MKKLIVIFFLILFASAEWEQQDEIALPKSILVNDLYCNNKGEFFILTPASIFRLDVNTKNLVFLQEITNCKLFALGESEGYLIDFNNSLLTFSPKKGEISKLPYNFNSPRRMELVQVKDRNVVLIGEPDRLLFIDGNEIIGTLNAELEKFCAITQITSEETELPIFTLTNNKIFLWHYGNLKNTQNYRSQIIYSSSEKIIDFIAVSTNRIYILFSDSILFIDAVREIHESLPLDKIPPDSRIFLNPVSGNIIVFNSNAKTLKIFSFGKKKEAEIVKLEKNRPNPVDNYTEIEFTLNEPLDVILTIYNLIGEPVKVIARGRFKKGTHILVWHADDEKGNLVPNGVYFYRLETQKGVLIKQLIVLR